MKKLINLKLMKLKLIFFYFMNMIIFFFFDMTESSKSSIHDFPTHCVLWFSSTTRNSATVIKQNN